MERGKFDNGEIDLMVVEKVIYVNERLTRGK